MPLASHKSENSSHPSAVSLAGCSGAVAWAFVVAIGGGFLCGWLIGQFGSVGSSGLYPLGIAGGHVSTRLTGGRAVPLLGWVLVAALAIALFIAEVYWIRFYIVGVNGWVDAVKTLPDFVLQAKTDVFVAAICCALVPK